MPTAALFRAVAAATSLGLLAVLFRRPDLLYLAGPLVLATVVGLLRRPPGRPQARLMLSTDVPTEGDELSAAVTVLAPGADVVSVVLAGGRWVAPTSGGPGGYAVRPTPGEPAEVEVALTVRRWGRHRVGPALVTALAADGLLRWGPHEVESRPLRVLPRSDPFRGASDVPQARGAVGVHRSARPGEGAELSGIRPFAPGDRLRRINWRVSLRTDQLHVNATVAERDAEVVLLLDGRYDAGHSGGIDGRASGIDVTVRAAAALARFYLRLGDRVGLIAQSERVLTLPSATGRRQLTRLLDALLDLHPPSRRGSEPELLDPHGLDPRALVVLLSPMVGRTVYERAAALFRRGHPLVVVDTLPADAAPAEETEWTGLALRLWRLQRATRLHRLAELGVPIVPWRGEGSLDLVLRDLARAGSAPRVRR